MSRRGERLNRVYDRPASATIRRAICLDVIDQYAYLPDQSIDRLLQGVAVRSADFYALLEADEEMAGLYEKAKRQRAVLREDRSTAAAGAAALRLLNPEPVVVVTKVYKPTAKSKRKLVEIRETTKTVAPNAALVIHFLNNDKRNDAEDVNYEYDLNADDYASTDDTHSAAGTVPVAGPLSADDAGASAGEALGDEDPAPVRQDDLQHDADAGATV